MEITKRREHEFQKLVDDYSIDSRTKEAMNQATDDLVRHIHNSGMVGYTVNRVFKGGSLKKGTVLNLDYDVDLVVFLNGSFTDYENKDNREKIMHLLVAHLRKLGNIDISRENAFVITLKYKNVHFDVLTAYNATITTADQVREQRVRMHELVKNKPDKSSFSTSFTESSCKFLQVRYDRAPEKLTRAIKLAKLWNKTVFANYNGSYKTHLRSYALELLLAKAFDNYPSATSVELFFFMLETFTLKNKCDVAFSDYFVSQIPANPMNRPLRIFDPCFPESDVISEFEAWDTLKTAALKSIQNINSGAPLSSIFTENLI